MRKYPDLTEYLFDLTESLSRAQAMAVRLFRNELNGMNDSQVPSGDMNVISARIKDAGIAMKELRGGFTERLKNEIEILQNQVKHNKEGDKNV